MIQPRQNLPALIRRLEKERAEKAKSIEGPTLLGMPIVTVEGMPQDEIRLVSSTRESAAVYFRQMRK